MAELYRYGIIVVGHCWLYRSAAHSTHIKRRNVLTLLLLLPSLKNQHLSGRYIARVLCGARMEYFLQFCCAGDGALLGRYLRPEEQHVLLSLMINDSV